MGPAWFRGALAALLLAVGAASAGAAEPDRLERFRALARELTTVSEAAERERLIGDLFALVDAEVLDSLRGNEPFSSLGFLRERLDGLTEIWGGASRKGLRVPPAGGRLPLTLGIYRLSGAGGSGSLRVYVGTGPRAALAEASTHDGLLEAHVWPAQPDRVARVLALWSGPPSAAGAHALDVELWEARAPDQVRRAWSTATQWPDGLRALGWRVRPGELVLRYEPSYPGWKPGCAGQLEHEDSYRPAAAGGLALARRQARNGWHRELGAAAERFFRALAEGDARALSQLVPAPALRARLPRALEPEPVCEQAGPAGPRGRVTVAATEVRDGRRVPWALAWARDPAGWRLHAAGPVLQ